ncbi:GLUCAN ENDO-13-BETA-GLUCOSIDASE BG1-RELATED-RELATED [Salix purpurea]|uniref:glucan endo-1,3-beta-D-glucosidase n=1 Tax=Salix purpurea TaxID=77065 RepID=A0A9Q0QEL3_SALPP|nr:GLUCAN ENDO-13-BETA-GLUCOSIDASE BG1-RELATED-RELATED [Salix purpurea]
MVPGRLLLLIVTTVHYASGAFVGINIGTDVSNMPSAPDVVAILKANQITHVRLYDADAHMLKALADSGIEVMVGVTNEEILGIGESASKAAAWINQNVAAYLPSTNITAIAVGSEVLTTIPNVVPVLVPAMNYLHKALVASNLNFQVKVSTPQAMDVIPRPFPPSTATFNSSWDSTIYQILQFLKNTNSYYMLNAYPYFGYTSGNGIFPLDYALFRSLPPVKQIVDPNTLSHYDSMFDAMVDAAYYSINALNMSGIPIVVTETGWPWLGGANEPDATADNAKTFNNNMIQRVRNDSGPPSQPNFPINTYIYEMFNEDKRPGPVSEKNWGLFFINGSSVYTFSLGTSSRVTGNNSDFCIAKPNADPGKLQVGLNWACGQGGANCSVIQEGQPCYLPNTYQNHASYAYNDYYQRMHAAGATCDFDGTATTTTVNPSYGSCKFSGSSTITTNSTAGFTPSVAPGPVTPQGREWNYEPASFENSICNIINVSCSSLALTPRFIQFCISLGDLTSAEDDYRIENDEAA